MYLITFFLFMYSLFKVPWKFEKSYSPPLPLQIIPKQALKKEKRLKGKRDMKAWSPTRRDEPAVLEGKPGRRKSKQQKCFPFRISFLLTHSRTQ